MKNKWMQDEETEARDRVIRRKMILASVSELIGSVVAFGLIALLAWLFCVVTPDQSSAENDIIPEVVH